MANITVYADPNLTVDVIAGAPPADQSSQISSLQAQVASLQSQLDAASVTINQNAAQISQDQTTISSLQSQVDDLQSQISSLNAQLTAATNQIVSDATTISNLQDDVASQAAEIATLNAEIASLQQQTPPPPPPAPTATLTSAGSTLIWSSTDATSASIDNGVGTVALSGTLTVNPTITTTYTLTVTGAGGTATATTTITVAVQPPPPSSIIVLDDFSQGIRQVPGYGPLWSHYQEGASGSLTVTNGSLVETVGSVTNSNGGGAYTQFTPKTNSSYAYPNGYLQHYILSGTWNPHVNRMSFKVTSNKAAGRPSNGSNNIEVGTYARSHTSSDPNDQGAHYYHQLGINFTANRPVYILLSDCPQHQVGVQNVAPGKIANYYDNLTRFYFDAIYGGLANSTITYDNFQLYQADYTEPDLQVASVWATYNGSSYELGWASPENSTLAYTVYCSPNSMHVNGLGTACGNTQGTGNTYICGPYVKTPAMAQPAGGMYFAIVPSGSSTFTEVFVPNS